MPQTAHRDNKHRLYARLLILTVIVFATVIWPQWRQRLPGGNGDTADSAARDTVETADNAGNLPAPPSGDPDDRSSSDDQPQPGSLLQLPGKISQSAAGLIYGPGSRDGHRLTHVMRHSRDDRSKPVHGVFDGDRDAILRWIDLAYLESLDGGDNVRRRTENGRISLTVDLQERIGFVGGQRGAQQNHPECRFLRLILEEDGETVVTAYPTSSF